jgi:gamma-glutamyltranspeptidase/glutathione hydrolase
MPATVAALGQRFGRLPLATVMEPAIRAAREGFAVTPLLRRHIQWCAGALAGSEFAARTFLPAGRPPRSGTLLRQPELAATLKRIAEHGADDFYRGGLARTIARDMADHAGLVTIADLFEATLPIERTPLSIAYRGHEVVTVPPPGGGLQVLLGLRLAETMRLRETRDEAEWHELFALVVDAVFRDRARWPISPERLTPSVIEWMLGASHARELAEEALASYARPPVASPEGPGDTTHLCVADAGGMVVSLTQSIQSLFGAKVANGRLGFFYNNYLCTCPRRHHPSQLRPGARPQSNAAPTIVFRGGPGDPRVPWLALGAAGSRRITSSILQVVTQMVERGKTLTRAVDAPRVHPMLGGRYMVESRAAADPALARLATRFRGPCLPRAARSYAMGAVQAIARDTGGRWSGAPDPRREGTADGD